MSYLKVCQTCQKSVNPKNWSRHLDDMHNGKPQPYDTINVSFSTKHLVYGAIICCSVLCWLLWGSILTLASGVLVYKYKDQMPAFEIFSPSCNDATDILTDLKEIQTAAKVAFARIFPAETFDASLLINFDYDTVKKDISQLAKFDQTKLKKDLHDIYVVLKRNYNDKALKCQENIESRASGHDIMLCSADDLKKSFYELTRDEFEPLIKKEKLGVNILNQDLSSKLLKEQSSNEVKGEALAKEVMSVMDATANHLQILAQDAFPSAVFSGLEFEPYSPFLLNQVFKQLAQSSFEKGVKSMKVAVSQLNTYHFRAAEFIARCKNGKTYPVTNAAMHCNAYMLREKLTTIRNDIVVIPELMPARINMNLAPDA